MVCRTRIYPVYPVRVGGPCGDMAWRRHIPQPPKVKDPTFILVDLWLYKAYVKSVKLWTIFGSRPLKHILQFVRFASLHLENVKTILEPEKSRFLRFFVLFLILKIKERGLDGDSFFVCKGSAPSTQIYGCFWPNICSHCSRWPSFHATPSKNSTIF